MQNGKKMALLLIAKNYAVYQQFLDIFSTELLIGSWINQTGLGG